ncbi:MAG: metallophosphoesterase family protein [Chloroflexi bacterium]|nr:metallophosphoesterase family protein [Chloroflexota bacterium]
MKVGVVSDVHNNVEALTYALDHLRDCDLVLGLGDLVSDYHVDPRILQVARERGLVSIAGNHEKSILLHPGSQIRSTLSADTLDFLRQLPAAREIDLDGRCVHVAHGAPWDDPNDYRCAYVLERDLVTLGRVAATTRAEVVLLGHTHRAMTVRTEGTLVINPGSCGEARDAAQRLTFARLDAAAGVASVFLVRPGLEPERLLQADF